jgi:SAM-dependent methyltransferase
MNSDFWDARYREKELVWSAGPNRFLVEEIEGITPGRALDLACGEGRNAFWLAQQGWQVTATDYSPVAIEKAKERQTELGLDMDFHVADATAPPGGPFDLIAIFYLHLPREENRKVLEHALAALAPGGTLLYVGHDERNIEEGIGGPQEPSILYGPEEIKSLLADLKIERAETVERPVEKEGKTHQALDILVRAYRPNDRRSHPR